MVPDFWNKHKIVDKIYFISSSDTLGNVRYSHGKLLVLSFSINHSVCFYYIDFRYFTPMFES